MASSTENLPGAAPSRGTMRIAQVLTSKRGANSALNLHPQGHRLLTAWCGEGGTVDLWGLENRLALQSFEVDVELQDVGVQPPPESLPVGTDASVDQWPAHVLPVLDAAMDGLGNVFALAAGRGARLFRMSGDESQLVPFQNLRGHEQSVVRVALDATGERAISADVSGQIAVWSIAGGRTLHLLRISKMPTTVGFIWNNMLVMAGDEQGRVICWEADTGRRHLQFQAHHGRVVRAEFSADSGLLVSVGGDMAARLWSLEEGKQIGRDLRHRSQMTDAVFAYAGRFIVSAGVDGHIGVWNATDGNLLDWHFDGAPVYRLAVDRLSGAVWVAGARTVKALTIDWQRLRELDADARSAGAVSLAGVDARSFTQPPSGPTATSPPSADGSAAVGTVMTARQTTDLPFPDRSNLAVPRGSMPGPARPGVGVGGPAQAAPSTRAFSAIGGGDLARPSAPGMAQASPTLTSFGDGKQVSLADAVAAVQRRAEENAARQTSYGVARPAAVPATSEANAFFSPVSPAAAPPENPRMSRMESDLIDPARARSSVLPKSAADELAPPLAVRAAADEEVEVDPALAALAAEAAAEKRARDAALRRRLLTVAIAVLVTAVVTRVAVYYYYTDVGYPSAVLAQANDAQSSFEAIEDRVNGEFDRYRTDEDAAIAAYRRSQSMSPESIERAVAQVQRRIDQRRGSADEQIRSAQRDLDNTLAELAEQRRAAASKLAALASIGGGVLALLASLLVLGRKPPVVTAPQQRPGQPAVRRTGR